MRHWARFSLPALFTLFLTGCAGIVGTQPQSATASAPQVSAIAQQTNGFATNRAIEVQFSTDMNPATINAQTFLLSDSNSQLVAGAVSYDQPNRIASFKPSAELQATTQYTATVTTGVADLSGRHLAQNYAFQLTTRASTDTSPIGVTKTQPGNGETCVSQTTNVQVSFSEGATASSVNSTDLFLTGPAGNVAATVTYDAALIIATITPNAALTANTSYTLTVQNVQDLAGVAMTAPYRAQFTTGPCGTLLAAYSATYTSFDVPGAISTVLYGINNQGALVGVYTDSTSSHAFFRSSSGVVTEIAYPGAKYTIVNKVNNNNAVVGEYADTAGANHGFIWNTGTFTTFDYPGAGQTYAMDINNNGDVVGFFAESNNANQRGYIRHADGTFALVPDAASSGAATLGNNDLGHLIADTNFFYDGSTWSQFNIANAQIRGVRGLNNNDQIAGIYQSASISGYVKTRNTFQSVSVANSIETLPQDINDSGVVVGWYTDQNHQTHGFIATPAAP